MRTVEELWGALLASSRMPWVGGDPVQLGGRRYLDGGLAAPIPIATALDAGATHVLILQTRPHGVPRSSGSRVVDRLIVRHLRRLNAALIRLYHDRVAGYEVAVQDIALRAPAGRAAHGGGRRGASRRGRAQLRKSRIALCVSRGRSTCGTWPQSSSR
jgi:predicted patatin/cPLA2 family phospholipase